MLLIYYNHAYSKKNNISESIESVHSIVELVLNNLSFNIPYPEMIKYYSLYSGNLDSKQIIKVLSKYGIEYDNRAPELQSIKKYRNILAHGEKSFEECGRELAFPQLEKYQEATFIFLEKMIEEIEKYLNDEKYKIS